MSTISDALKKAQKQRQGGLPAPAPVPPPHEPSRDIGIRHSHLPPPPRHASGKPSFILILICVSAVTSVVVFYCLRGAEVGLRQGYCSQGRQKSEARSQGGDDPLPDSHVAQVPDKKLPAVQPETPVPAATPEVREVPVKPATPVVPVKPEIAVSGIATNAENPVDVAVSQPPSHEPEVSRPVLPRVPRTDIPVLGGTFYSEKNPVAIINGSAMKEGETIGAYQVVKILPLSVKLKCDGEDIEIRLR